MNTYDMLNKCIETLGLNSVEGSPAAACARYFMELTGLTMADSEEDWYVALKWHLDNKPMRQANSKRNINPVQ